MMNFRDTEVVKKFESKFKKKFLDYVEAMFGQKSDIAKIHDWDERKRQACILSGLDYDDRNVRELIDGEHEQAQEVIFTFHTFNSSLKFQSLCTDYQLFWRIHKTINSPIDDEQDIEAILIKRTNLSNLSQEIEIRIDRKQSEIFGDGKDIKDYAEGKIREMLTLEKRLKMNGSVR